MNESASHLNERDLLDLQLCFNIAEERKCTCAIEGEGTLVHPEIVLSNYIIPSQNCLEQLHLSSTPRLSWAITLSTRKIVPSYWGWGHIKSLSR